MSRMLVIISFIILGTFSMSSQDNFFITTGKPSHTIPFKFVNNMVVIPVEVNGKELSFLLDTGIDKSILFNFKFTDSLVLKDVEKMKLYGLGGGESLAALRSRHNLIRIGKILNLNHLIYIVLDEKFDLSAKMGMDINGIIGGDLFKDLIIGINYSTRKITFYDPGQYTEDLCRKCMKFPLDFYANKPYIDAVVTDENDREQEVKLLIDSGGSDALWLFENAEKNIRVSENYYKDYLGQGLSGNIFGKRSKINRLSLGDFHFNNATVSYPDSSDVHTVHLNKDRNGTLGAEILKRFNMVIDYPNRRISLRKNSYFNDPFRYNKSGIELVYGGKMLVKEEKNFIHPSVRSENKNITYSEVIYSYELSYKPTYEISLIRPDSPAFIAGLKAGDKILEINGNPAWDKKLQDLIRELSGKEGKKIRLRIERNGKQLEFKFRLKDLL